jgi:hypothetical protein
VPAWLGLALVLFLFARRKAYVTVYGLRRRRGWWSRPPWEFRGQSIDLCMRRRMNVEVVLLVTKHCCGNS